MKNEPAHLELGPPAFQFELISGPLYDASYINHFWICWWICVLIMLYLPFLFKRSLYNSSLNSTSWTHPVAFIFFQKFCSEPFLDIVASSQLFFFEILDFILFIIFKKSIMIIFLSWEMKIYIYMQNIARNKYQIIINI